MSFLHSAQMWSIDNKMIEFSYDLLFNLYISYVYKLFTI